MERLLERLAAWPGTPAEVAADEAYWSEVRGLFAVDPTLTNLNNGGVSPSPCSVLAAMKRHLDHANQLPAHVLWEVLKPRREVVRQRLARALGCDPEEVALTRNASEALQSCQLGLDLEPGDEVVTTNQDYERMLTTWEQRVRRDRVVVRTFSLPLPTGRPPAEPTEPAETAERAERAEDNEADPRQASPRERGGQCGENGDSALDDEIVARFAAQLTPRTRLVHLSHVVYFTGQILPVERIVALARERGIPALVDGAHAFAQLPFAVAELGCDYYGASLHKWLMAPHGTGLLYARRERIAALWPLMAAPEAMDCDIRKFEEIGTHPEAPYLAVLEALDLHEALGIERKQARLRYLRDRWARRLASHPRVRLLTSLRPGAAAGFATFAVSGPLAGPEAEAGALGGAAAGEGKGRGGERPGVVATLAARLWQHHRILVTPFEHPEFDGIRVTPSFYSSVAEVDRFCAAVEEELSPPR
ncbi:MAG TPA: aminotransferase class V-fold PLP-dependent enzyme [Thermoanaerobaculia bacterium]|nr:aminotransferase class V-fold PLP-dependent enzyme [Thermoanaerobaculia bacterium]